MRCSNFQKKFQITNWPSRVIISQYTHDGVHIKCSPLGLVLAHSFSGSTEKMKSTVFLMCPGSKGVHNLSRSQNLFHGASHTLCVSLHTWVSCDFAISFLRLAGCILLAAHLLNNLHARSHLHAPHESWTSCEMCVSCMALKNLDDITKAAAALSSAEWIFCVCRKRPSMETWWIIIICALTLIIVASHLCAHSERRDARGKNGFWARAPARPATKSGARTHVCVVEIIICAHTWLIADCWCQGGSSALFDSRTFAAAI